MALVDGICQECPKGTFSDGKGNCHVCLNDTFASSIAGACIPVRFCKKNVTIIIYSFNLYCQCLLLLLNLLKLIKSTTLLTLYNWPLVPRGCAHCWSYRIRPLFNSVMFLWNSVPHSTGSCPMTLYRYVLWYFAIGYLTPQFHPAYPRVKCDLCPGGWWCSNGLFWNLVRGISCNFT